MFKYIKLTLLILIQVSIVFSYTEPTIPLFEDSDSNEIPFSGVYPIGWSENGKLAWISYQFEDGIGMYEVTFQIQDMIHDTIITSIYLDYMDDEIHPISYFWREKSEELCTHLTAAKIIQSDLYLQSFSTTPTEELIVTLSENCTDSLVLGTYQISNTIVLTAEKGSQKKIIHRAKTGFCKWNTISGYLQSPFEDRIAVLFSQMSPGYEGPPHPSQRYFIGCHTSVF